MQTGKFNVIVDGQWGSTGKGLISGFLAHTHKPDLITSTNMANAGHTVVAANGDKYIAKALPAASIIGKWHRAAGEIYHPMVVLGAGAAFHLDQLLKEVQETDLHHGERLRIHPRAGVITQAHREAEGQLSTGPKHIASTMQGCGTYLSDKILRKKDLKLARDYEELKQFIPEDDRHGQAPVTAMLHNCLKSGMTIMHEGAQGFSLDINHGSHYPACTSRGTTAMQNLADMGLNHTHMGDVYMVLRPFPIRVGNIVEDGKTVGHSGGNYDDHEEISWEEVAYRAGTPDHLAASELTTVTKRVRRVFTWSRTQAIAAAAVNGASKIALNFANYIDYGVTGCNQYEQLSLKVLDFVKMIEDQTGVKVALIGTGPQLDHVCVCP